MALQHDTVASLKGLTSLPVMQLYTVPPGRIFTILDWFVINNTDRDAVVNVRINNIPLLPGHNVPAYHKYAENNISCELVEGDYIVIESDNTEVAYYFSGVEQDAILYDQIEASTKNVATFVTNDKFKLLEQRVAKLGG